MSMIINSLVGKPVTSAKELARDMGYSFRVVDNSVPQLLVNDNNPFRINATVVDGIVESLRIG